MSTPEELAAAQEAATRKAAEDKIYAESAEGKAIEARRAELLKREEERKAAVATDDKYEGTYSEEGIVTRHSSAYVAVPDLDAHGNKQYNEDGTLKTKLQKINPDTPEYTTRTGTNTTNARNFYFGYNYPWDPEVGYTFASSTSPGAASTAQTVGAAIAWLLNNTDGSDNYFIYSVSQRQIPQYKELEAGIVKAIAELTKAIVAQRNELSQNGLIKVQKQGELAYQQELFNDTLVAKVYHQQQYDLALAAENAALASRDAETPGSSQWNHYNNLYLVAKNEREEEARSVEVCNLVLAETAPKIEALTADIAAIDKRNAELTKSIEENEIDKVTLTGNLQHLRLAIDDAKTNYENVLKKYPTLEEDAKKEEANRHKLDAEEQSIKDELAALAKKESALRDKISQDLYNTANDEGRKKLYAALDAAKAGQLEKFRELNKPIYTEKELQQMKLQKEEAAKVEEFRKSRADKGKMGFSGCDITAVLRVPGYSRGKTNFNENLIFQLGTLQTIAISTYNSKTPIKSIGFKNPIAIARGGRTIAGTMIFNQLHRHVFDDNAYGEVIDDKNGFLTYSQGDTKYFIESSEIAKRNEDPYAAAIKEAKEKKAAKKTVAGATVEVKQKVEKFKPGTVDVSYNPKQYEFVSKNPKEFTTINQAWDAADEAYLDNLIKRQAAYKNNKDQGYLSDEDIKNKTYINKKKLKKQWDFSWDTSLVGERIKPSDLPPFDIIIMLVNEMGNVGKIILYGVEIIHDSQTLSVEDIYTEAQYQYIAKDIEYFHADDFDEIKAWSSSLPNYGYKGFYLANIEDALSKVNSNKLAVAAAEELLKQAKAVADAEGKDKTAAEAKKAEEIKQLNDEISDLENQKARILSSSIGEKGTIVSDLLKETQEAIKIKEDEIKALLVNPYNINSDFAFYSNQINNYKKRVAALEALGLDKATPSAVTWTPFLDRVTNSVFKCEVPLVYNNPLIYLFNGTYTANGETYTLDPEFGDATQIYKIWVELQSKLTAGTLEDQLAIMAQVKSEFLASVATFWDISLAANFPPFRPTAERIKEAKDAAQEFVDKFKTYQQDTKNFTTEKQIASNKVSQYVETINRWPVKDRDGNDIVIEDLVLKIYEIINNDIGPKQWQQYKYYFWTTEQVLLDDLEGKLQADIKNGNVEGRTSIAAGDEILLVPFSRIDDLLSRTYDSAPDAYINGKLIKIDFAKLKTPFRLRYKTSDNKRKDPRYGDYPDGNFIKDFEYTRISLKPMDDAQVEFDLYKKGKISQSIYQFLNTEKKISPADIAKLDINKRYKIPGQSNVEKTTVLELFEISSQMQQDVEFKSVGKDLASYYDLFTFRDTLFGEQYQEFKKLRLAALRESNENKIAEEIISNDGQGFSDSLEDLNLKRIFYERLLKFMTEEYSSGEVESSIKELDKQIADKKIALALVLSGNYDASEATTKGEETRTNLESNVAPGPSEPSTKTALPPSISNTNVPAATAVPAEPDATSPAPEQTSTRRTIRFGRNF